MDDWRMGRGAGAGKKRIISLTARCDQRKEQPASLQQHPRPAHPHFVTGGGANGILLAYTQALTGAKPWAFDTEFLTLVQGTSRNGLRWCRALPRGVFDIKNPGQTQCAINPVCIFAN